MSKIFLNFEFFMYKINFLNPQNAENGPRKFLVEIFRGFFDSKRVQLRLELGFGICTKGRKICCSFLDRFKNR